MESTFRQEIKYNSQRDPAFAGEIRSAPGCERLEHCIQCGTCSATCPLSIYMDLTPRRIIHLARSGFRDEVLASNTIWLCSSCYSCTVECPKEIKITDIMYALKRLAIVEGSHPRHMPIPVLADEFMKMVRKHGRINEGNLAARLFLRHNLVRLFKNSSLGLKLMKRGRFSMKQDKISKREELRRILSTNGNSS